MATDPRHNVRPGDKLRIAAEQINWINRQMRGDTGFKGGELAGYEPGKNIILARNNTGSDLPRWGVMAISGIEIDPATDDTRRRSFEEMPCINGVTPEVGTGWKFVIAVEPIKAGKIGRVCAAGIVQAKVLFVATDPPRKLTMARPKANSFEHLEASDSGPAVILWSAGVTGESWALIRFGEEPRETRIGKVDADWLIGTCASVEVWESISSNTQCVPYEGIGTEGVPETITDVANVSCNVRAGSWVVISRAANDRWYLADAGLEGSCRQTIGGEDITKWTGWDGTKKQILGHDENGCLQWFDVAECDEGSGS